MLGSAAHALCTSLISIHFPFKCSVIHLERMLRLPLRVKRTEQNERRQRSITCSKERSFKLLLFFLHSTTDSVSVLHITNQARHFSSSLTAFEMSNRPHKCRTITLRRTPHCTQEMTPPSHANAFDQTALMSQAF